MSDLPGSWMSARLKFAGHVWLKVEIIMCMHPANERQRYSVTHLSLAGRIHRVIADGSEQSLA